MAFLCSSVLKPYTRPKNSLIRCFISAQRLAEFILSRLSNVSCCKHIGVTFTWLYKGLGTRAWLTWFYSLSETDAGSVDSCLWWQNRLRLYHSWPYNFEAATPFYATSGRFMVVLQRGNCCIFLVAQLVITTTTRLTMLWMYVFFRNHTLWFHRRLTSTPGISVSRLCPAYQALLVIKIAVHFGRCRLEFSSWEFSSLAESNQIGI